MLSYKNKSKLSINSIKFNNDKLAWAANENSKERFKSNEILWTLQCTEKYSKKIIDLVKNNKNYYLKEIAKEFENLIGFKAKDLIFKNIHGWRYAYLTREKKLKNIWIKKISLGICADWMIGSKAEDAWLSANSLFKKTKKNPVSL
jgi:renalase